MRSTVQLSALSRRTFVWRIIFLCSLKGNVYSLYIFLYICDRDCLNINHITTSLSFFIANSVLVDEDFLQFWCWCQWPVGHEMRVTPSIGINTVTKMVVIPSMSFLKKKKLWLELLFNHLTTRRLYWPLCPGHFFCNHAAWLHLTVVHCTQMTLIAFLSYKFLLVVFDHHWVFF